MQTDALFVGVDAAKATLDVYVEGDGRRDRLANDSDSIDRWLEGLPAQAQIAVESTGRCHLCLAQRAHDLGHLVFVLNARDVYFYAKGLGARGKTDRLDAEVVARYLAEHHARLKPWQPTAPALARLRELLRCRAGVTSKRESLRQLLRDVPEVDAESRALEGSISALLGRLDAELDALVAQDPKLQRGRDAMGDISGIGPVGSAMLTALFSRVPFNNADAVVAYSGLDPRPNDSGKRTGRRRISKRGSALLRRQLYLAALGASHSHALGPTYRAIKARGFAPTQALVILARKILRIAWAVWKSGKPFDPALLNTHPACAGT